jgi:hypothetical protein
MTASRLGHAACVAAMTMPPAGGASGPSTPEISLRRPGVPPPDPPTRWKASHRTTTGHAPKAARPRPRSRSFPQGSLGLDHAPDPEVGWVWL